MNLGLKIRMSSMTAPLMPGREQRWTVVTQRQVTRMPQKLQFYKLFRRVLAAGVTFLAVGVTSGHAWAECRAAGSNKEQSPTWCVAYESCSWNETLQDCVDKAEKDGLAAQQILGKSKPGDSFLTRNGYDAVYAMGDQSNSLDEETIQQALGCPSEVLDYVGRYTPEAFDPAGGVVGIESASDYIEWPTFGESATARERKIRLRTAWLSLREGGACRQWFLGPDRKNPDFNLTLSREASDNWKLAKKGNAFNGVIDCRTWEVFLVPQNPRSDKKNLVNFNQLPWTNSQLKSVKPTRAAKASGAPRYPLFANSGLDHGTVALMSEGQSLDAPKTFADWCRQEKELKANYLGFNVWTDATNGKLEIKYTSRQLNGPNLDTYRLTVPDNHGNYTANTEFLDGRDQVVYSPRGKFLTDDQNEDLTFHRGVLSIEIAVALKRALSTLPLPKK